MDASARPPGWYEDPPGPGQRYWDGSSWTDRRVVPGQPLPVEADPESGLKAAGFILAAIIPAAGLAIGIVLVAKRRVGHGLTMIATSVLASLAWSALFLL